MLLSEAKEILKKNGFLIESIQAYEYGSGKVNFKPTGADGQWPERYDFICKAIMNNNVDALLDMMHDGIQVGDYSDGEDDESNIDFDEEYEREFYEDYSLVFKGKYIGDALEFMLKYESEFYLATFDMINLFFAGQAGCEPETLYKMVSNYINISDEGDNEALENLTWKELLEKIPV